MTSCERGKILINASNLHSGGGVQVAVSFLYELTLLEGASFDVVVSSEIDNELKSIGVQLEKFRSYNVYNIFGLGALVDSVFAKMISSYDVVFTIFGPLYTWKKPKNSIVGFAQPWIVYPNNEVYKSYGVFQKIANRLKYFVQRYFYFKSDVLIVELEHVKVELRNLSARMDIPVVNNCISSVYFNRRKWKPISYTETSQKSVLLGIVTRDYPHKNLNILPSVASILKSSYNINVRFLVTLTEEEWFRRDSNFHACSDNIGPIGVAQCPAFYSLLDGVIFPSLLECFSATPIEAMIMKKPVFASDRLFVRQACGDFVEYFDPVSPESIADCIARFFFEIRGQDDHDRFLNEAYHQALRYSNPSLRAKEYIRILEKQ